ncbi:MAG: hypothetical protein SH850_25705 [Planctomycetaceae bacterium]|nr:hypothetical protein [Planctomycetaceae bacterium]
MSGGFGGGGSRENPNPTFLVSQAAAMAQQCCQRCVRILTIARLYPDTKQIKRDEYGQIVASIEAIHSVCLAPRSDTEDPHGGTVLLYDRRLHAVWFSQRPEVKRLLVRFVKMRLTFMQALSAMCGDTSAENQRVFKQQRERFGELAADLEAATKPTAPDQSSPFAASSPRRSLPQRQTDDTGDDLVTVEELAFVVGRSVKRIRNLKILGDPDIAGGGRGIQAKWRYGRVKPVIESAFHGLKLPEWSEARSILNR